MTPFFVVDRPMSLEVLLAAVPAGTVEPIGLLTHAYASSNFLDLFRSFSLTPGAPPAPRIAGQVVGPPAETDERPGVSPGVLRMCDSGIFERGAQKKYSDLFQMYEACGADFGVMQDVLCDPVATYASAKLALAQYARKNYSFRLVLVAQGNTTEEYLASYERLRKLAPAGTPIALGGLLRKRARSVRYLYVGSETGMYSVIESIRRTFDPEWLFVLGAYHPSRHAKFEALGVTGSDYKGWIFQYAHRRDLIDKALSHAVRVTWNHGSSSLHALYRRRVHVAAAAEQARHLYVTTKNGNAGDTRLKRGVRQELAAYDTALMKLDAQIARALDALAARAPHDTATATAVASLRHLISTSDREIRKAGVRDYLAARVFAHSSPVDTVVSDIA